MGKRGLITPRLDEAQVKRQVSQKVVLQEFSTLHKMWTLLRYVAFI
jgi:hypothetical protein